MLVKVKMLDYSAGFAYAPPQVDALVNTDHVVSAKPTEARGSGPFLCLKMVGGETVTVVGSLDQFTKPEGCYG